MDCALRLGTLRSRPSSLKYCNWLSESDPRRPSRKILRKSLTLKPQLFPNRSRSNLARVGELGEKNQLEKLVGEIPQLRGY